MTSQQKTGRPSGEYGSIVDTAAEYRRLNGLPDEEQHIDQDDVTATPLATEPDGGYGGEEGAPDTATDTQGALPFAVQRAQGAEGDLDESAKHMADEGDGVHSDTEDDE